MTPQIRPDKRQLADLATIRELGAELIREAVNTLKRLPPSPILPSQLNQALKTALSGREAEAESLFRQVLSLHGLARRANLDTSQVFAGLRFGLQPEASEWTPEQIQQWTLIEPLVQELFDLDVVRLSAKALDLSYAHAELLENAQILTDVRPVFGTDASAVRAVVISHSLLLRYDDTEGDHILSLAMDEKDIRTLKEQCDRALKKSGTVEALLKTLPDITVLVPGKGNDGDD